TKRRAAEQLLLSGRIDEGIAVIEDVLRTIGLKLAPTPFRALLSLGLRRVLLRLRGLRYTERPAARLTQAALIRLDVCWSVAVGLGLVDNVRGADYQARHLLLALKVGEPYRVARALALEVGFVASGGGKA